jgi:hypothetical protein
MASSSQAGIAVIAVLTFRGPALVVREIAKSLKLLCSVRCLRSRPWLAANPYRKEECILYFFTSFVYSHSYESA